LIYCLTVRVSVSLHTKSGGAVHLDGGKLL
jgi:hypothetical protein